MVEILLGTSCIDECVWYALPTEQRTVAVQSKPAAVISVIKDDKYAERSDVMIQVGKKHIEDCLRTEESVLPIWMSRKPSILKTTKRTVMIICIEARIVCVDTYKKLAQTKNGLTRKKVCCDHTKVTLLCQCAESC